MLWAVEGMGMAAFAAGVFGVPGLFLSTRTWIEPATSAVAPAMEPSGEPDLAPADALEGLAGEPRGRTPTPLPGEKLIFIDLVNRPQTMTCYEGIRPVMRFVISGSRMGTDDVGDCLIRRKSRRQWYAPDSYWMQWWMTLQPDTPAGRARAKIRGLNGVHATPASNYRRLGRPASHGCIRMRLDEARQVWQWTPPGTRVFCYRYKKQKSQLPIAVQYARG